MYRSFSLSLLAVAALLAACTATTTAVVPTLTPTPGPSLAPSTSPVPVSTPGVAASGAPSFAPTATTTPFAWKDGKLLKAYDFKGLAGIYYDASEGGLFVVDGVNDDQTPRRYLVRKFDVNGVFSAAFKLAPDGGRDPEAVDGMAFDRRGIPFFTYRDFDPDVYRSDRGDRTWKVLKLITASVLPADKLPANALQRAGVSTIASDGDTFTYAALRYDPKKDVQENRQINYARAEEDQTPEAIFAIPDPFEPTARMAMAPSGTLYLAGPLKTGGFAIKRLGTDQKLADFTTLSALPNGLWVRPEGPVYVSTNSTSGAAIVTKFSADGTMVGSFPVKLNDGSELLTIAGLTFDNLGRVYVTGTGWDASKQPIKGIFTFTE